MYIVNSEKSTYENIDEKLKSIQADLTEKISETKDDDPVKFYLRLVSDISKIRLSISKEQKFNIMSIAS